MAAEAQQQPRDGAPVAQTAPTALPDYLTDPNATSKDLSAAWRYGMPPDYTNTRKVWAATKYMSHEAGSLPALVENLVKNWEVEASFKTDLADWRTIDRAKYSFAVNGGPPQDGEHMLKVGTYNAIIAPNQYYSPQHSDFASSHKTFKRMMPTFAWEVLEVYSGPPRVAFKWRHWGVMKNDYVGFNNVGEKIMAKAHGGPIDIQGITVAEVDDKVRLQKVETWFDPLEMFRQIAPNGVVNKQVVARKVGSTLSDLLDNQAALADKKEALGNGAAANKIDAEAEQSDLGPNQASAGAEIPSNASQTMPSAGQVPHSNSHHDSVAGACPFAHSVQQMPAELAAFNSSTSPAVNATIANSNASAERPRSIYSSAVAGREELSARDDSLLRQMDRAETRKLDEGPFPHPHDMEAKVQPAPGEAIVVAAESTEAKETKAEMSAVTGAEEDMMNAE